MVENDDLLVAALLILCKITDEFYLIKINAKENQ